MNGTIQTNLRQLSIPVPIISIHNYWAFYDYFSGIPSTANHEDEATKPITKRHLCLFIGPDTRGRLMILPAKDECFIWLPFLLPPCRKTRGRNVRGEGCIFHSGKLARQLYTLLWHCKALKIEVFSVVNRRSLWGEEECGGTGGWKVTVAKVSEGSGEATGFSECHQP